MAIDCHVRGNDDVAYGSFNVSKNLLLHTRFLSRHTRDGGYPLPVLRSLGKVAPRRGK